MSFFAQIAIPSPLDQLFTYRVPEALQESVQPGMRVVVPFRNKEVVGFCMALTAQIPKNFSAEKLKTIVAVPDALPKDGPIFSETMLSLITWLADYYMAPIGEVCRSALPNRLSQLKTSAKSKPKSKEERHESFHEISEVALTPDQKKALEKILGSAQEETKKPFLLHGITGSGKTEIYLQFVSEILKKGGQAILLVPEISLTPQLIGRAASRLKVPLAIYHSGLTETYRHLYWEKIRSGEVDVVIGTRSALFAPFKNLKAIIVDEEQDPSYKQGEGSFHYHARDAAIVRGKLEGAQVLLGSATPSLESFHNAKKGKYHYSFLSARATGATLPEVRLIDLRKEEFAPDSKTLSRILKEAIQENLYRGEQTLLLLNRRGFANFLLCQDCGKPIQCPNCAISLTYHKPKAGLLCHYCDYSKTCPEICPDCKSSAIKPLGVGTQLLEEELKTYFPSAVITRLDRDTSQKRKYRNDVLHDMKKGKVDILLGTQIVAKGHDFSNLTLVGVILADTSLNLPDFRSAERTFHLLTQVSGRAGRAKKKGRVLIQTFHPEHATFLTVQNHNFDAFSEKELQSRSELFYPPFARLAQIRLQSPHAGKVEAAAKKLKLFLETSGGASSLSPFKILGPAKSPIEKLRGKYRWQLLVKGGHNALRKVLGQAKIFSQSLPSTVQLQIDVDALNLM